MCTLLVGCKDSLTDDISDITGNRTIKVGGVVSDDILTIQTRAGETTDTVRAETVDWLKGALRSGLDITYSNLDSEGKHVIGNQHVAILKWTGNIHETSKRGDYTFKYKIGGQDAEWYDNGPHYFEGEYVPEKIRTTGTTDIQAINLTTNQSDDSDYTYTIADDGTETTSGTIGNYTLLSHYVGMPPNWTTSATVDQVLLPFKHRLARVIAYILIDPELKDKSGLHTAQLKGYKKDASGNDVSNEDPTTTELRFANVKVLEKVQEVVADANSDAASALTPVWTEARRVIPHFETELTQSVNNKQELAVPNDASEAEKTEAQKGFIVYTRKRDEKPFHPREDGWYEAHKDYLKNGPNSAYTQKVYKTVPVYDVIVRPTYQTTDDVMYDEAGYYNNDKTIDESALTELAKEENSIEFEMMLNNDLVYTKKFDFDLNANQQTIVYITIDRESINYDESKSEQWISTNTQDNYYGVNNDLGHNMSMAGSSWQRAFRNSSYNPGVTDGNDYGAIENGEYVGQYVNNTTWIKAFAQAYMDPITGAKGLHHGDYFILDDNITIDATLLPDNFVFTGHLDGRGHTITVTKLNTDWQEDHYVYEEITPAVLYTQDEIDAAKAIVEADDYEQGSNPEAEEIANKTTSDIKIAAVWGDVNHPIPHTSGSSLFAGLNATYTTAQENAANPTAKDPATGLPVVAWEANVHKEGNYWVPVAGYRAELYNTTLSGGTFFPEGTVFDGSLTNPVVTGYIYNCWEGSTPISNQVPIPMY